MLKEFKKFIMTGNVVDLAVAVIMATAIGGVVKGFVDYIVMPFVGYFTGGTNFANLFIALDGNQYETVEDAIEAGGAVISYGLWINTIVNLIIVGFVMFMIVKSYNKVRKKEEKKAEAPKGPTQEELLAEIRDLLRKQA